MFQILAHRGLWRERQERNTLSALVGALKANFGLETDVRDRDGELVISHDPPDKNALPLQLFLEQYCDLGSHGTLALNIKSDGLAVPLKTMLAQFEIVNYFVFDMSIPDNLGYLKAGIPFYARQSEYEPVVPFFSECAGVWLDSFVQEWYAPDLIRQYLAADKGVCVVSPELHNRPHEQVWEMMFGLARKDLERLSICTDFPFKVLDLCQRT